jgi:glycosyltransferase involved in cell wall biosynthesis
MPTFEKIPGLISLASNSPGSPTGYGQQGEYLVERLVRHGVKTALLSNYGLEGRIETIKTKHGDVAHYPRGVAPYSQDVLTPWHEHHRSQHDPGLKHAIMTLYDVWVYNGWESKQPVIAWVPMDHVTTPPSVAKFLMRENVTPVAMAPHGLEQLTGAGIEAHYIPHSIDTKVFQRTEKIMNHLGVRVPVREVLGVPEDTFLVTIIAANKANGLVHRKGFSEAFLGFSLFHKEQPNSHLYVHADPSTTTGGFDLGVLAQTSGIPANAVTFGNRDQLRIGYSREHLAGLYTASDVLLATSYGEGFGVPTVEALACGTRVIASGWAASKDLVSEDSWLVDGQVFWDEPQKAFYQIPNIAAIVTALSEAYEAPRGFSPVARKFALQFDVETVWDKYWMPFLREYFAGD